MPAARRPTRAHNQLTTVARTQAMTTAWTTEKMATPNEVPPPAQWANRRHWPTHRLNRTGWWLFIGHSPWPRKSELHESRTRIPGQKSNR